MSITQIMEGFHVKSVHFEIFKSVQMPENNSTNASSMILNQLRNLIPPCDKKQQEGPKNL